MQARDALEYHARGRPGKIEIGITKPGNTQAELSLAYTPGVAEPVREIVRDPLAAYRYTAKGNLVAVVTNGTAVLGLGNVGPLAAKPVMEGKALLFKRFADVDAFDLEVAATGVDELVRVVSAVAPTFGGINLEDIRSPDCFEVERRLSMTLDIPVFHDDQHGTAIVVTAALLNALELAEKRRADVRVVISGAGAAAIATARLFERIGIRHERITLVDSTGVVYRGRVEGMNGYKAHFASDTEARTLAEALYGADAFVGLSVGNIVTPDMLRSMAARPIVFALANPDPEIEYGEAKIARPDAIVATGRSDHPNQVNNVLAFPSVFRAALDVRARTITQEMQIAAAQAIAALARETVTRHVLQAYGRSSLAFGPKYILPKPLDPRLVLRVAPAVARAALAGGVARVPIDIERYPADLAVRLSLRADAGEILNVAAESVASTAEHSE